MAVETIIATVAVLIALASFLRSTYQTRQAKRDAIEHLEAVDIGEVQAALDQIDREMRMSRHALHDLAVEMARMGNDGERLQRIIHRVEEPLPTIYRLRDPLQRQRASDN